MSGENSLSSAEGETLSSGHEAEPTSHTAVSQAHAQVPSPTGADQRRSTSHSLKSHQSRTGRPGTDRVHGVPVAQLSAKDRFRSAVRKVIAVHRTATLRRRPGAEPGVDPRRQSTYAAYGHIRQKCVIDVIDYSSLRCSFGRMSNTGFIQFLQNNQASAREPWVKVRWINIGGISWDVVSALAIKYGNSWSHRQSSQFLIPLFIKDMHPLSVEDLLNRGGHALSKADYYPKHLFIRVLCHTLDPAACLSQDSTASPPLTDLPRSASPQRLDQKLSMEHEGAHEKDYGHDFDPMADEFEHARAAPLRLADPEMGGRTASLLSVVSQKHLASQQTEFLTPFPLLEARRRRRAAELTLDELKKEDRVGVHIEPMCIFLFRDGNFSSPCPFTPPPNQCSFVRYRHIVQLKAKS
jgi:hypothetical protein